LRAGQTKMAKEAALWGTAGTVINHLMN
jgi:hypothetical protein